MLSTIVLKNWYINYDSMCFTCSVICLTEMDSDQLGDLHSSLLRLEWHSRGGFGHEAMRILPQLVKSIVNMCRSVQLRLHPTPSKPQYVFDTRDIAKVSVASLSFW